MSEQKQLSESELQDLVASSDTGGRAPTGFAAKLIVWGAIAWSLFQLYFASPLPFFLQSKAREWGIDMTFVLDDTKARSIHLAFALFLGFLSYPAFKHSPKYKIPYSDWFLAIAGAFLGGYYFWFYGGIVERVGNPNTTDLIAGVCGILVLLEGTRRCLGAPLAIIAIIFLIFNLTGPYLPQLVTHNQNSLSAIVNQQWVTTEGVFGIALGVSTKFVFLFVLFGALLDKAGAGNYFIKTAFSLLGHMRGGPAKAAVVASGATGLISGSSIANVVTTGTFTIPMMKRVGFSKEKSGAVEVASSVNGQIMPPVMGAAAFLMVEYVGISYFEVVKHAIIPALISYIALFYIVHLEALKAGMQGLPRAVQPPPTLIRLRNAAGIILGICILSFAVYYLLGWMKPTFGENAIWAIGLLTCAIYVLLVWHCAKFPTLEMDDPNAPVTKLPEPKPTVNSGLHFLLPVVVLIWCLMIERMSPGTSAFYGASFLIIILLTQKSLFAFFRKEKGGVAAGFKAGWIDLLDGLETGARNMIGIGIATATAGIIVGVVALTNIGAPLAEIVEIVSMGNLILMLIFVGILSLILGMGLPTTANYIVVSALLAGVIVEVGQQNGLVVPLIAVHLFVFYFGIMADVTPPVGLASFAAAAVSGGSPIKTGFVAFFYSLRTAILPFLFIFNTDLLLIGVDSWAEGILIFVISTIAILVFTAALQGWFFAKNRWYEAIVLTAIAFAIFRPGFFMDYISPSMQSVPPTQLTSALDKAKAGNEFKLKVTGLDNLGDQTTFSVSLPIEGESKSGEERLEALGIMTMETDGKVMIDTVTYFSQAQDAGLAPEYEILAVSMPNPNALPKQLIWLPAFALLALVIWLQRRRNNPNQPTTIHSTPSTQEKIA